MSYSRKKVAPVIASVVGVLMLAFLWILVTAEPNTADDADSPLLGQPAPSVVSTTIDDQEFVLANRKGSWVIFNFFNSTCVPCIADASVRAFFSKNGGDWPKVRDTDGAISVAFGVAKVPETWVIDPNGFVRLRIAGMLTPGLLDDQLAQLKTQFGS